MSGSECLSIRVVSGRQDLTSRFLLDIETDERGIGCEDWVEVRVLG